MDTLEQKYIEELQNLVKEKPDAFSTIILHSKRYLYDFVFEKTSFLDPKKIHKIATRVFYVLNNLQDYLRCKNSNCNKPIIRDVAKINKPQLEYCCTKCQIHDSQEKIKRTLIENLEKKYEKIFSLPYLDQLLYLKSQHEKYLEAFIENSPKNKKLLQWINEQTPLLNDSKYTIKTKIYWIINGMIDFIRCANPNCNKAIERNVRNLDTGYLRFSKGKSTRVYCSRKCSTSDKQTQKLKTQTCQTKYGVDNVSQCSEVQKKIVKRYFYNGVFFASAPEIAYYIWLSDNNIEFEYQPCNRTIKYQTDDGLFHTYHPDFYLIGENRLQEIKGKNNFDENGYPIRNGKKDWHEKYKAMLDNDVEMLMDTSEIILNAMSYCEKKFGKKTWFRQFKNYNKFHNKSEGKEK